MRSKKGKTKFSKEDNEILEEIILHSIDFITNELNKLEWDPHKKMAALDLAIDALFDAKKSANEKSGFNILKKENFNDINMMYG
jgi:hypothetical protein